MSIHPPSGDPPSEDSVQRHQAAAAKTGPLGIAVLTLSDSRTEATDTSGRYLCETLTAAGHQILRYRIVTDDSAAILQELQPALADPRIAIIITTGGTGVSLRDNAFETISRLLDKRLDGFGELFRMLSYAEIGAAAMLSRAVGGIAQGKVVFSLPGSTKAVKLGLERLILPQAGHLYWELHR
jgi:molybdenum cofactor biosynthesis protein B